MDCVDNDKLIRCQLCTRSTGLEIIVLAHFNSRLWVDSDILS
jgi:hypothetical protein